MICALWHGYRDEKLHMQVILIMSRGGGGAVPLI